MRIRLQYSLLTLLGLTTVCAVVIAFVIVPWRHEKQQDEIMARLEAHRANEDHYLWDLHKNDDGSFDVVYRSNSPQDFQLFIDLANGSERIRSLALTAEGINDEQLAKLKQLPKLEELYFEDCDCTEARMQILNTLPLKELEFRNLNNVAFQTWPIQPRLESLKFWMMPDFAAPPLKLLALPSLRELNCDSCPKYVEIDSCPALENLWLSTFDDENPTTLKLSNLPKLNTIWMLNEIFHAESQLQELPALQKLTIRAAGFPLFQNLALQNLRVFEAFHSDKLSANAIEKLLRLPQLEEISFGADWQAAEIEALQVPLLHRLLRLELSATHSRGGSLLIPEGLARRFIRQCPALQMLKIQLQDASDELLRELAQLPNLGYLELNVQGKIGDLSVLRDCKQLTRIQLHFKEFSPERISELNDLQQLEYLEFSHNGAEDIDLAALNPRPKLTVHYNHSSHKQNFPILQPHSKVPLRIQFNCNPGVVHGVTPPTTKSP